MGSILLIVVVGLISYRTEINSKKQQAALLEFIEPSSPTPTTITKLADIATPLKTPKLTNIPYTPTPTSTPNIVVSVLPTLAPIPQIIYVTVTVMPTPTPTPADTAAPIVDHELERWRIKIVSSFSVNDWCKNGGKICGVVGLEQHIALDPQPSSGIVKLDVFIDDILKYPDSYGNGNGKIAVDLSELSDGEHSITVKAYDAAGNVGTGSVALEIGADNR